MSLHQTAVEGYTKASAYDAHRPSYSNDCLEYIAKLLSTDYDKKDIRYDILELGAGTGKFTKGFLSKISKDVKYLASEPMDEFYKHLKEACPDVAIAQFAADAIQLPDESVAVKINVSVEFSTQMGGANDIILIMIIAAHCFHWFANDKSLREIRRVLMPGGKFVCIWNLKNRDIPWIKDIMDYMDVYFDDTPRPINRKWEIPLHDAFSSCKTVILPGPTLKGSKDYIIQYFVSLSVIARLDEKEKQMAISKFSEIINNYSDIRTKKIIDLEMNSEIVICHKC